MDDKTSRRRELRLLQQESVWLQKGLFALRKADTMHEKVSELRGEEEMEPYNVGHGAGSLPLSDIEDAMEEHIESLMKTVKEMRRSLR
ncbi:MAG TPA: hypothetical protein VFI91_12855 [Longimicrobiaceae bacterium]|nr:hypothetical protein [Longimicrobiaceae bacterium]